MVWNTQSVFKCISLFQKYLLVVSLPKARYKPGVYVVFWKTHLRDLLSLILTCTGFPFSALSVIHL